jgi:antitoxin CptB
MTNKESIKKIIIYRSTHRGSKEMDLLLGNFVKENIDNFNEIDLKDLNNILSIDDETLYNWYFERDKNNFIPSTKVSKMLKKFKFHTSGGRGGIRTHE